jgi:ATP-dependent RNA helicase RhlE
MPEHEYLSMHPKQSTDQSSSENAAKLPRGESFQTVGIGSILAETMARQGIKRPRPVQTQVIPEVLAGRDIVSLAETGSGKTLAFLAPVLQRILDDRPAKGARMTSRQRLRALVICPTRELADQTGLVADGLLRGSVLRAGVAVGSVAISPIREMLLKGVDLLVVTPGRLLELLEEGSIDGEAVQMLVIDEADRMFDMGFAPQVSRILDRVSARRQLLLFSATMPKDVLDLADQHLRGAVRIETHPHTMVVEHVKQHVVMVHPRDRVDLLLHLQKQASGGRMLIFCRTRRRTGWVAAALARHALKTGQLHADRSQAQRRRALEAFRGGELDVLVATDVGSRGLHIEGVAIVVNYDLPNTTEDLVHRAGRAAHGTRKSGHAWTFIGERELDTWYKLAPAAGVRVDPERVAGFTPTSQPKKPSQTRRDESAPHETRKRPGPGRRKRASRPIGSDQKPGRGVRKPRTD